MCYGFEEAALIRLYEEKLADRKAFGKKASTRSGVAVGTTGGLADWAPTVPALHL